MTDGLACFRDSSADQYSTVAEKTDFVFNLTYRCNFHDNSATDLILTLQEIDRAMSGIDANWTDLVDVYGSGKYDAFSVNAESPYFQTLDKSLLAAAGRKIGDWKQTIMSQVLTTEKWRENTYYIPKNSDKCCISWLRETQFHVPLYSTAKQECVWKCYSNSGGSSACKTQAENSNLAQSNMADWCLSEIDSEFAN